MKADLSNVTDLNDVLKSPRLGKENRAKMINVAKKYVLGITAAGVASGHSYEDLLPAFANGEFDSQVYETRNPETSGRFWPSDHPFLLRIRYPMERQPASLISDRDTLASRARVLADNAMISRRVRCSNSKCVSIRARTHPWKPSKFESMIQPFQTLKKKLLCRIS